MIDETEQSYRIAGDAGTEEELDVAMAVLDATEAWAVAVVAAAREAKREAMKLARDLSGFPAARLEGLADRVQDAVLLEALRVLRYRATA